MKLFKKKEKKSKKEKSEKRKGCLTKLMVFGLFLAVFIVGVAKGLQNVSQLYGEQISVVTEYIQSINKPVNESELIFNPIDTFQNFAIKAQSFGFYGYENLSDVLELEQSMTLKDNEIGALISSNLKKKTELLTLGEFSITSQNTIRAVFIYDLGTLSSVLEDAGNIVPEKMYITVDYEYTVTQTGDGESHINYVVVNKLLNQLEQSKSDQILGYLDKIDREDIQNPLDTYDSVVFNVLNTIALKTESTISLDVVSNQGYIYFTLD